MFLLSPLFVFIVQCVYDLIIIIRGGFRHVRPNRGPHRNGAPTWGKRRLCMSFLTIFCWLLGALPPDPHRGSAPGHCWGDFRHPDPLVPPLQKFLRAPMGAPTFFLNRVRVWVNPALIIILLISSISIGISIIDVTELQYTADSHKL